MIDYERALNDEPYAMWIPIDEEKNICYDDYIFVLSSMFASKIPLNMWHDYLKSNPKEIYNFVELASVEHCLNWNEAVSDYILFADLSNFDTKDYMDINEARDLVKINMTPFLLRKFIDNKKITNDDVLCALEKCNVNN